MSTEDHRAAARELSVVHLGVLRFKSAVQRKEKVPGRILTRLKRIQRDVEKIRVEMQKVQMRTLPHDDAAAACWRKQEWPPAPVPVPPKLRSVMTRAAHIAAARDMGEASRAAMSFAKLVCKRNHLPVRIIDLGLWVERFIQLIRHDMHYVRGLTLPHQVGGIDCWAGQFNYFDGDEDGGPVGSQPTDEEQR
jgi:hypothetical protein